MSIIEKAFRAGFSAGEDMIGKNEFPVSCADVPDEDQAWAAYNPAKQMSTTELWNSLQAVLLAKGATQEWVDYALPDLHGAALQFSFEAWGQGFLHCEKGEPMPNPPHDDGTSSPQGWWAWCPIAGEETWRENVNGNA
jgi:hypothetical protein